MSNMHFKVPPPYNEPVLNYATGSAERAAVKAKLRAMKSASVEIPLIIAGKEVKTGHTETLRAPHDHTLDLGVYHKAGAPEVRIAIEAALAACSAWTSMPWEHWVRVAESGRSPLRTVAANPQRRYHAGAIQDGIPSRNRCASHCGVARSFRISGSEVFRRLAEEEIFGPVLTMYVYDDDRLDETLALCDETSPYGADRCRLCPGPERHRAHLTSPRQAAR